MTWTARQGDTQFTQAAALGPNGLTLGPNKVQEAASEQQRVAQGNLGIQNVKIGKDGLIINDGSRLNSSVQVVHQTVGCLPDGNVLRMIGFEGRMGSRKLAVSKNPIQNR